MVRKLILRTFLYLLPVAVILLIGLCLPPTPHSSSSLLFGQVRKDSLLRHTAAPRIVFMGGSNVPYGLNCQAIKDSLHLNPVNAAITRLLGLEYTTRHILPLVKDGDVVVLISEYDNFFGQTYKGYPEYLLRVSVELEGRWDAIRPDQLLYLPKMALGRFNPNEYNRHTIRGYTVDEFNEYGDASKHWDLPSKHVSPDPVGEMDQGLNPATIRLIRNFQDSLAARGARLYISYPCFMETSFRRSEPAVRLVEAAYKEAGFRILGTPDRYMTPDSLMYDTPYHLNKRGVDLRTQRLIEDLSFLRR